MRKTLILVVALIAALVFSACESVSAHSPPAERYQVQSPEYQVMRETKPKFIVVGAGGAVGLTSAIAHEARMSNQNSVVIAAATRDGDGLTVSGAEIPLVVNDRAVLPMSTVRTPPKTTSENGNAEKRKTINHANFYDSPSTRFAGFGVENSARAKI